MTTRVLSILGTAYRGTVEEQDDTILWLLSMCSVAGLDVSVLLRGNAVNYGVRGQDGVALRLGDAEVARPPSIDEDVADLMGRGVAVHYVTEDAVDRGIAAERLVDGLQPVGRGDLPAVLAGFNQVWHW